MNLINGATPLLLWVCGAIVLLTTSWALRCAPWRALIAVPSRQHAAYATCLFLAVFWLLNVEVREVLILHPLLMTAVVMVFGGELALLIGNVALLLGWVLEPRPWTALPVDSVLSVVTPTLVTLAVLRVIDRFSFTNLFVYMLGGGFAGAILSVLAMGLVAWALFGLTGASLELPILEDNALLVVLLMFPEGFINGTVVTMLTVFKPELLRTFDDHKYLDDQ